MCDIWRYPTRREEEISAEIVAKLPTGLGRINLTGGEPMLRDDIEELVKVLYGKCKKLEISTNGYFTERIIKVAQKYPNVMIRVSLEGLPKLNDDLRGIKDGFDHALRTILELKKTKVKDFGFSVVICDKNAADLIALYDLCSLLNIEFGNSTMHNSWYFHKSDNKIDDVEAAVSKEREFIAALLSSKRKNLKLRIKDWLRAYFNLNILLHLEDKGNTLISKCCAGKDLFRIGDAMYRQKV
jgi:MoaA/NifB/PqqE/SkfB family radical SAM enzyme